MIEEAFVEIIREFGFPTLIVLILLYDKMKTNGSLLKVVENNNILLKKIEGRLK